MRNTLAIIFATSACLGCRDAKIREGGSKAPFTELGEPWSELTNVNFGMPDSILLANRPAAKVEEYNGIVEVIGADTIYFRTNKRGWPYTGSLMEVASSHAYATDSAARDGWNRRTRDIEVRLGQPDDCLKSEQQDVTSEDAIWHRGGTTVRLTLIAMARSASAGKRAANPARVLTTVSSHARE
jgi:hypothetical protein